MLKLEKTIANTLAKKYSHDQLRLSREAGKVATCSRTRLDQSIYKFNDGSELILIWSE